jgi:hypothetical protein
MLAERLRTVRHPHPDVSDAEQAMADLRGGRPPGKAEAVFGKGTIERRVAHVGTLMSKKVPVCSELLRFALFPRI